MKILADFEAIGGTFVTPPEDMRARLLNIRAFLFDWDGVFNNGMKYGDQGSPFSEEDSMGTNLLRLGYWLTHDRKMPITGVVTGATNQAAEYFVNREHFDVGIRGYTNKHEAWEAFLSAFDITPEEVAFVYDDVLDLSMAQFCTLKFCVRRDAGPAFNDYVVRHGLCDYRTGRSGGSGAVREISELILTLNGTFDDALTARIAYADTYRTYLSARSAITPLSIVRTPAG